MIGGARGATIVANALTSIIAARLLGPDGIGVFAVGLAFYAVLMIAAGLGLGVGTSWQVGAGNWSPDSALASTRIAAVLIGCAASGAGAAAFILGRDTVFDNVTLVGVLVVLSSIPPALIWSHASNVCVAAQNYELGFWIPAAQAATYVVAVAVLASLAGVEGALAGLLVSHLAAACLAVVWSQRALGETRRTPVDRRRLGRAVSLGLAIWVGQLLAVAVQRADLFLLSAVSPREEVGHYAVAVAVTTPLWLIPTGLGAVLVPRMAGLTSVDDSEGARALATRSLRHATLVLLLGAGSLAIFVAALLPSVYGDEFRASVDAALILLPGTVALGLAQVAGSILAGRGKRREFLVIWLAVLPVAGGLYATLVPAQGAMGAATASSLSYALAAVVAISLLGKGTPEGTWRRLMPGRTELDDYRRLWGMRGIRLRRRRRSLRSSPP